jgi:hypothetical protein
MEVVEKNPEENNDPESNEEENDKNEENVEQIKLEEEEEAEEEEELNEQQIKKNDENEKSNEENELAEEEENQNEKILVKEENDQSSQKDEKNEDKEDDNEEVEMVEENENSEEMNQNQNGGKIVELAQNEENEKVKFTQKFNCDGTEVEAICSENKNNIDIIFRKDKYSERLVLHWGIYKNVPIKEWFHPDRENYPRETKEFDNFALDTEFIDDGNESAIEFNLPKNDALGISFVFHKPNGNVWYNNSGNDFQIKFTN